MGNKGDNHRIIEHQFASYLEKFNNNNIRWFLPKNSIKKVRLYIFSCLGGSPEKITTSHITRGNNTYKP